MNPRILLLCLIAITMFLVSGAAESADAQVVVGGRTYVQVPNRAYFRYRRARPMVGYYIANPYSNYGYYNVYVRRPYYSPYGNHYYPHRSYYYAPAGVRYGNPWNQRRW